MEVILNINDLQIDNLWKNLSLSIGRGTMTTIAGANHSGKTTLAKILDRKIEGKFNINLRGRDIKEYSLEEYNQLIQVVYPNEIRFTEETPLEEMKKENIHKTKISFFRMNSFSKHLLEKETNKLTRKERILVQILLALGKANDIVVLDDIDYELNKEELDELYAFLKAYIKTFKMSIIITTLSLEQALKTNEIYIIDDGEVLLHGDPISVLQKDNILNKAGLEVPFMIDLSVKLRDYDLIKKIDCEKEELIDTLWK